MPEPKAFTCNLCEALCGLDVTVDGDRVVSVRGRATDVFSRGHVCPKGVALKELYDDPDRLRRPLRRTGAGFVPVSWEEALDEVATRLRRVQRAHGRDAVGIYVGNPAAHSHRTALGAQLLTLALGTRHRFDPNSQDSNPRLFACLHLYGDGLSMPVPDIDRTDLLVLLGANPLASSGSQMGLGDVRGRFKALRERGGRVVVVDPRRTETARTLADRHHFIRPGGDAALLLAILHVLFDENMADRTHIERISTGLPEIEALARRWPPERVATAIGLASGEIRTLARELGTTRRAVVHSRVGTCQGPFGPLVAWLTEVVNVVAGHFDVEGGAMFPSPAADVGPLARLVVGNHFGRWRSRVRGLPEFLGALPSAVMAEEMETPGAGQLRALVVVAGNPVLSTPNGPRLARAMASLEFSVAVDFYLNETSRLASVVLPPAHVFQSGSFDLLLLPLAVRNVVKYSPPILPRGAGEKDDWELLSELALRLRIPSAPRRLAQRAIAKLPERVIDSLLRLGPHRLSLAKLSARPDGLDLGPLTPGRERRVFTPGHRVRLAPGPLVADLPRLDRWLDEARPTGLVLIGRRHLRSNNSWMHNLPSLVKGPDRARLLVHPDDARRLGLTDGGRARVDSRVGSVETLVQVSDEVMPGVVSLPHGYGHTEAAEGLRVAGALAGASMNALTDDQAVEPLLGTSILNGVPVTVRPRSSGSE